MALRKRMGIPIVLIALGVLAASLQTSAVSVPSSGLPLRERHGGGTQADSIAYQWNPEPFYSEYLSDVTAQGAVPYRSADILPSAFRVWEDRPVGAEDGYEGFAGSSFLWDEAIDWVEYDFQVPEEGLYEILADYYLPDREDEAVRSLEINGKVPFSEAYRIAFLGGFRDRSPEPLYNSAGDEISPSQVEVLAWRSVRLSDSQGMYDTPLRIRFSPGLNTVRIRMVEGRMRVGGVRLVAPGTIPTYEEYRKGQEGKSAAPATRVIEFQAERPVLEKSSSTIRGTVHSHLSCEPRSVEYARINTIGDWRWRLGNQSITWEFEVPESGTYNLGIRYLQWWHDGLPAYRQVLIDGRVPFAELLSYRFPHTREWTTEVLSDRKGKPFDMDLAEGTHTLTLVVKMGEITPLVQSLYYDNLELSELLLKIMMITGSEPDVNYDYELLKKIPNLPETLQSLYDSIESKSEYARTLATKNPGISNQLRQVMGVFQSMIRDPESIPRRLNDIRNAQSSLGTWYLALQEIPIVLDRFEIVPSGSPVREVRIGLFERVRAFVSNLLVSFVKDYDSLGTTSDGEATPRQIKVWIGRGKEWAEVIRQLAADDFTRNTGISVRMNVLPASQLNAGAINALMMAISAGKAPDVALCVSNNSPVEFAIRKAVLDLSAFDGFDSVTEDFLPGILVPFEFENGMYGLPETMNFKVLMYRKDVVSQLGIGLPNTWEDLYQDVLPALYRNNLQFFYPQDFTPFLFQRGGSFYRDGGVRSGLDAPEAFQAFREYCELYTHYGIPVTASFYNRMRTGEIPMGIAGYPDYLLLTTAAPELAGRWGIAPIPGTEKEDGSIDRSVGGIAGEADVILSSTRDAEAAWSFLSWWLSADVQVDFAREIEAIVGTEARWNTANIRAFSRLNWKGEDLEVIQSQWAWARDMENVLGGYFTSRHLNNAWNRVVLGNQDVRSALEEAVEDIDKELRMKQEEYNRRWTTDGEASP